MADSRPVGTRHGRLRSIDVLRGVAALGVVLFHATDGQLFLDRLESAPWMFVVGLPASMGFSGVYLFFVISGFCIHLAWARQRVENRTPLIAFVPFWKRRIRRLYPPYLVALGLYLLLLWLQGAGLSSGRPVAWDVGLHLAMLHNLDPQTAWSINGVFWTLAIEEQLYLAYFLLLGLRGRLGWPATFAICLSARVGWFGLAFLAHRGLGIQIGVTEAAAAHWFAWALGAWSVEAWYGLVSRPRWATSASLCGVLLLTAALLSLAQRILLPGGPLADVAWLLEHPLWGLGFFIVVNRVAAKEQVAIQDPEGHEHTGSKRVQAALLSVGLFSYSLYLTHELLLTHLAPFVSRRLGWSDSSSLLWRVFVMAPLAVGLASAFYRLFERPFVTASRNV